MDLITWMQKNLFVSGALPNIIRNAIVNCSELVTYDVIKELILKNNLMTGRCTPPLSICSWRCEFFHQRLFFSTDNMPCHFTAAFSAGLCTTVVASPVDVVKTRYMNSVPGQYGGALNCAATMLITEGPTAFYKGWAMVKNKVLQKSFLWSSRSAYSFMPSFLRLLSWNIVMFVSYEQFKRAFQRIQQSWS